MKPELYFPDVQFVPLTQTTPTEVGNSAIKRRLDTPDDKWSFNEVYQGFCDTLQWINHSRGTNLTLGGRSFQFIRQGELIQTTDEAMSYVEHYGPYIINGIRGDCKREPDGSFSLRIAYKGGRHVANVHEVLSTMFHEYGHTLGPLLPDVKLEELKADTFECIGMDQVYSGTGYKHIVGGYYADNAHHVAYDMLNQLRARGFSYEAILAHLTGEPFGVYKPDANVPIPLEASC